MSATVGAESVCVSGDLATVQTYADCVNPIALAPTYNPVQREVIFRQIEAHAGPGSRDPVCADGLQAGGRAALSGIRAFDGAPLGGNTRIEFSVAATNPPQAMPEAPAERRLLLPARPRVRRGHGSALDDAPHGSDVRRLREGRRVLPLYAAWGATSARAPPQGWNLNLGGTMFNRIDRAPRAPPSGAPRT